MVDVGCRLMIFPFIHDLIGMFWIISSDSPIHELTLRDFVVGGLVGSELGFDQQTVSCSVPGHMAFLVLIGH